MYRRFLYLITASLLVPLLSCRLQKEPFRITYKVLVRDLFPHCVFVSYNTPDGLEIFICSEKEWSKEVCLYPDDIASLVVEDIYNPNDINIFSGDEDMQEEDIPEEREWKNQVLSAQIIHEKKIILATGEKRVQASLLKSETE